MQENLPATAHISAKNVIYVQLQPVNETGMVYLVNHWTGLIIQWLYDSSGKREIRYKRGGTLGVKPDDLNAVASFMNKTFGAPVTSDKARGVCRRAMSTTSVEHVLRKYQFLEGIRENY